MIGEATLLKCLHPKDYFSHGNKEPYIVNVFIERILSIIYQSWKQYWKVEFKAESKVFTLRRASCENLQLNLEEEGRDVS